MSRIVLLVAGGFMLAVAMAPLQARAATPGTGNGMEVPEASAGPTKPTRYCVVATFTGSHVEKKTCLTRDEWLKRGFDPLQ